jgi:prophage antirepressor-like protein
MDIILTNNFQNFQVRTLMIDDEPWFIAKDIGDILKIKNISDAMKDFDDDEKSDIVLNYDGQISGKALILSESGLYSLIMRSRKPIAKPFQKWVTKEVLPSIRKTGAYSLNGVDNVISTEANVIREMEKSQKDDFDLDLVLETSKKMMELGKIWGLSEENLYVFADRGVFRKTGFSPISLFPERDYRRFSIYKDEFEEENELLSPTQIGEILDLTSIEVNKKLEELGYQKKIDGVWKATNEGREFSETVVFSDSSKTVKSLRWRNRVVDILKISEIPLF